jgi:hypothetical protein
MKLAPVPRAEQASVRGDGFDDLAGVPGAVRR